VRRFKLRRQLDHAGNGGAGEGVVFRDGKTAIHWYGLYPFTVLWDDIEQAIEVYSHDGATELVWLDPDEQAEAGRPLRLIGGGDDDG
jgi:hypothetical protein